MWNVLFLTYSLVMPNSYIQERRNPCFLSLFSLFESARITCTQLIRVAYKEVFMEDKNMAKDRLATRFQYGVIKTDDRAHIGVELDIDNKKLAEQMAVFGGITVLSDDNEKFEIASGGASIALSRVPLGLYSEHDAARKSYTMAQRVADAAKLRAMLLDVYGCEEREIDLFLDWRLDSKVMPTLDIFEIIELFSKQRDIRIYYRMREHHLQRMLGAPNMPLWSDVQQYQMRLLMNIWFKFNQNGVIKFDETSNYLIDDLSSVNALWLSKQAKASESSVKGDNALSSTALSPDNLIVPNVH